MEKQLLCELIEKIFPIAVCVLADLVPLLNNFNVKFEFR